MCRQDVCSYNRRRCGYKIKPLLMRPTLRRLLAMSKPRFEIVSLPRPAKPAWGNLKVSPDSPWIPLEPHPGGTPPALPSRPYYPPPKGWDKESKVLPAAYPRTYDASTGSLERESMSTKYTGEGEESKEERTTRLGKAALEFIANKFKAMEAGHSPGQKGLWLACERWTRKEKKEGVQGVTLVVAHANGFTKEVSWVFSLLPSECMPEYQLYTCTAARGDQQLAPRKRGRDSG